MEILVVTEPIHLNYNKVDLLTYLSWSNHADSFGFNRPGFEISAATLLQLRWVEFHLQWTITCRLKSIVPFLPPTTAGLVLFWPCDSVCVLVCVSSWQIVFLETVWSTPPGVKCHSVSLWSDSVNTTASIQRKYWHLSVAMLCFV